MTTKQLMMVIMLVCMCSAVLAYDQHIDTYHSTTWMNVPNAYDEDWATSAFSTASNQYLNFNVTVSPDAPYTLENVSVHSLYLVTKIYQDRAWSGNTIRLQYLNHTSGNYVNLFSVTTSGPESLAQPSSPIKVHRDGLDTDGNMSFILRGAERTYFYEANISYSFRDFGLNNCSSGTVILTFPSRNISTHELGDNYTLTGWFAIRSTTDDFPYYTEQAVRWDNLSRTHSLCMESLEVPEEMDIYGQLTYRYNGDQYNYYIPSLIFESDSSSTVNLYQHESTAYSVLFTIVDENDDPVTDSYIYTRLHDIGTNTDHTISILKTDDDGAVVIPLMMDTQYYTFIVMRDNEILFSSSPTIITTGVRTIRVTTGTDYYTKYRQVYDIDATLTFINASKRFELDYVDIGGSRNYVCMDVINRDRMTETELFSNCTNEITAIIRYNYTHLTNPSGTFIASAYIVIDGTEYVLDTKSYSETQTFKNWGDSGLLFGLGLFITLAMLGVASRSPTGIIIYTAIGLIFAGLSTLIYVPWETMLVIVAMAITATILISRRSQ